MPVGGEQGRQVAVSVDVRHDALGGGGTASSGSAGPSAVSSPRARGATGRGKASWVGNWVLDSGTCTSCCVVPAGCRNATCTPCCSSATRRPAATEDWSLTVRDAAEASHHLS